MQMELSFAFTLNMKNSTTSASIWKRRPSLSGVLYESVTCLPLPRCLWSVDSQLWKLQRGLKVSSLVVSDAWAAASSFIHRWVRLEELQAIAAVARSRFGRRNAILGSAILDKLAMESLFNNGTVTKIHSPISCKVCSCTQLITG